MRKDLGFTLIEILIALTIFAILATITSSSLYYAFNTRNRVNAQAERINELQFAISIIQQDTSQIVDRAVRGNDMVLHPSFVGQHDYLEFTRDGFINPGSIEKRSTLKRVALLCKGSTLIHRAWPSLDMANRSEYVDKVVLDNISKCHFSYINQTLQSLDEWREQNTPQKNERKEFLPKALQLNFVVKEWGEMNFLFMLPEATYE